MRARLPLGVRWSSSRASSSLHGRRFDAIVVGGGHNGLVAVSYSARFTLPVTLLYRLSLTPEHVQASYLAKAGRSVVVLERRPVLGGAAVTEEIVPG